MEISSFSHVQAARRRLITRPLTVEEEIEALKYARNAVIAGRPYICALIGEYVGCGYPLVRELAIIDEINEFLDDNVCVESWLGVFPRYTVVKAYRIAIIDTLLARRGVIIKEQ